MPHKRGQFSENKIRATSPSLNLSTFYKSYLELTMMTDDTALQRHFAIATNSMHLCKSVQLSTPFLY